MKITLTKDTANITIFLALLLVSGLSATASAQATQRCQGSSICDVRIEGGQLVYENCQSCGTNVVSCQNEVAPRVVERICRNVGVAGAECADGTAQCGGTGIADPNKIVKFTVYVPRGLNITAVPERRASIANRTAEYKITIENRNPVAVDALLAAEADTGWRTEIPQTVQLGIKSKRDITLKVTSPEGSADGDYFVKISAFGFQSDNNRVVFNGQKTVIYQVASRTAPSVALDPTTQTGLPSQKLTYNLLVTNNDPADFDPTSIALSAAVPANWQSSLSTRSIRLKPGETGTVKLDITPDAKARQGQYDFTANATANGITTASTGQLAVSNCGDGVCGLAEVCAVDCPLETDFACNGRCEQQSDTGVDYLAEVRFSFTNFIVCSKGATPEKCRSAFNSGSCGINKDCLCGNRFDAQCSMRCVDNAGAYYLAAGELGANQLRRSKANYSFECPFVNLDDIRGLRQDFKAAQQDFEKSRSGLKEKLNKATRDEREQFQPCFDGLGQVIDILKGHVQFLDGVIQFPAVSNTTEARSRSADVRQAVDDAYNLFCRGATGALRIVSINAPGSVEKDKNATAVVNVKNTAGVNYFGYLSCDFTPPRGSKTTVNTSCTPVSAGRQETFTPQLEAGAEGTWKLQCRTIASLKEDCSSEVHDQSNIVTFEVFSRDTFVKDVSGACTAEGASCTVRLSNKFACAGCRIEDEECTKQSQSNDTTTFTCPRAVPGKYNLTGYVAPTAVCNPVEPKEKTVQIRCEGCGDGVVKKPQEQCELPETDSNPSCGQTELTFVDNRRGVRDKFGFCTPQCQCSADDFIFSCVRGVGGAECSDGETRAFTTANGTCTQQCGPLCSFLNCTAEQTKASIIHSPAQPTTDQDVTLTATGQAERATIFADSIAVAECDSLPCTYTQRYQAGRHTYFVSAIRLGELIADPPAGTRAFTVAQAGGQPSPEQILAVLDHTPSLPTAGDRVTIRAQATAGSGIKAITLSVDNATKKTCTGSVCEFSDIFSLGTHRFAATVTSNAGKTSSSETSFTVSQQSGLRVSVTHTPTNPRTVDEVFLTANGNGIRTSIFADGLKRIECLSQACQFSQFFSAGQHTYFAIAEDSSGSRVADPLEGTKIFNVGTPQPGTNATNMTNATNNTNLTIPGENITIGVSHAPQNPGIDDNVTIIAAASRTVDRIDVFVDNFLRKTCNAAASCSVSQKLAGGLHEYYGVFAKNNTTARTPTGQVFVSSPSLVTIQDVDVPEQAIFGSTVLLSFGINNPNQSAFGQLQCAIRTPTQARAANSQCFPVPPLQSRPGFLLVANELGVWNVSACELNISARSDCFGSQRQDFKANLGTFTVIRPADIFITNVRPPQSVVINTNGTINVTAQNPLDRSRFVRASCSLKAPNGGDSTVQSQCAGVSLNSSVTFSIPFVPDQLGTWQLASCSSDSSLAADCSNANRTQTLVLARPVNVVKSDRLEITGASLSSRSITVGDSVSAAVQLKNPTDIDRFAQVACTFRTQNAANLINTSECTLLRKDTDQNVIVTIRPPFVGRWNATGCTALSSLNVDCAQRKQDDATEPLGIFDVNTALESGGGFGGGGGGFGGGGSGINRTKEQCEVLRFEADCSFIKSLNRYEIKADVSWNGGDHAHAIIGDDTGARFTDRTFTANRIISTPGRVFVKPEVHNANDTVLCSRPSKEVFCVPGNITTSDAVQIVRNMKSASAPGPVDAALTVIPLDDISGFMLTEYMDKSLVPANIVVTGNRSIVTSSSRTGFAAAANGTFTLLDFSTQLRKGQNITIAYTVSPAEERDYKFFYAANFSGTTLEEKPPFNLFITKCPQIKSVLAVGPGGSCQTFRTSCDVPKDWEIREKCPEAGGPPGGGGGDSTGAIIVVVIIIVIAVIAYRKRNSIRERLGSLKRGKGTGEEFPTLEGR